MKRCPQRFQLSLSLLSFITLSALSLHAESLTGTIGSATAKGEVVMSSLYSVPAVASTASSHPRRRHPELNSALANLKPSVGPEVATRSALLPTASFLALVDNNTSVPPDTNGAVGPTAVITALNSQICIQDKAGTVMGTLPIETFFASVNPGMQIFDPRVIFDSLSQRFIFSGLANAASANAGVCIAVSESSDPGGSWLLYYYKADSAGGNWIDFDNLGVNKDWIVLSASRVANKKFSFISFEYFVFNKADLFANGAGKVTLFSEAYGNVSAERMAAPAITFDSALDKLYIVENSPAHDNSVRISAVSGAVGSETLTTGIAFAASTDPYADATPSTDLGPQAGASVGIDTNDSLVHRCVYRNGSLWCAQSIFLPANQSTRASVQWWQFTPDGTVQQRGRIDDPTGAKMYTYPSIAVNKNNDVLIGYSRFSTSDYASAACSFRQNTDAPNSLQAEVVIKSGESTYVVSPDPNDNRWGDYSATCVDPANDTDLWTIQEYAHAVQDNGDYWSTWWARISPVSRASSGLSIIPNPGFAKRPVSFTLGLPLTSAALWNFGDGSTQIGSSVMHTYSAPGTYVVSVGVVDSNGNFSAAATLQIFNDVNGNGIPDSAETDADGDGFPDAIEVLAGTDPNSAASTPVNNQPVIIGVLPGFKAKLNFDLAKKTGTLGLRGALPVSGSLNYAGMVVYVDALQLAAKYTLDSRGQSNVDRTNFLKLSLPRNGSANFSASLPVDLSASKLTLANQGYLQFVKLKNQPLNFPVQILFNGTLYESTQTVRYTSTPGKKASAH